jgi:CMP/dCMP kinase
MTTLKPIIAIDGPAGSGKSTIAKIVAKKLGLFYIDTGAMYRALVLKARLENVDPMDTNKIVELAKKLDVKLDYDAISGNLKVFLDGKDVSEEIRKPFITDSVSIIAKIKEVREYMVAIQRKLATDKKAILEGRDITTVVFPDAYKKFYLDASGDERAKRRYLELKNKKIEIKEEQVKKDIDQRDKIDSTRECAPLTIAKDAIYVDTTNMTIEEVTEAILQEVSKPS